MESIYEKDQQLILHPFTPYQQRKHVIPLSHGKGAKLYDIDGNEYIDAIASWWVNLHGHCHPYINEKIAGQLQQLEHVIFSGFTHEPAVNLAERLLHHLGNPYEQLFYSDNGSTSVEVAIKMAVQFWKNQGENRKTFIAFENAYHGDTFGAMAVSERDVFTQAFTEYLFEVEQIPIPTRENIDEIELHLIKLLETGQVAAFIFEPLVQGAGGMRMYEANLLNRLITICKSRNVLTIADEVMTGFYHTGTMFAIDQLIEKPDFCCLSKGLTGGYLPLGVTAFSTKIAQAFRSEDTAKTFYHGHSFTANPISCTAALASLDLIELQSTVTSIERIHSKHLSVLPSIIELENVENVRVKGVIMALDVVSEHKDYFYNDPLKIRMYEACMKKGVLIRPLGNVVYVLPPYCITDDELEKVYDAIIQSIKAL
jgi:adenosylmethionine-8-amino-7-oxononanoate aminotransferase